MYSPHGISQKKKDVQSPLSVAGAGGATTQKQKKDFKFPTVYFPKTKWEPAWNLQENSFCWRHTETGELKDFISDAENPLRAEELVRLRMQLIAKCLKARVVRLRLRKLLAELKDRVAGSRLRQLFAVWRRLKQDREQARCTSFQVGWVNFSNQKSVIKQPARSAILNSFIGQKAENTFLKSVSFLLGNEYKWSIDNGKDTVPLVRGPGAWYTGGISKNNDLYDGDCWNFVAKNDTHGQGWTFEGWTYEHATQPPPELKSYICRRLAHAKVSKGQHRWLLATYHGFHKDDQWFRKVCLKMVLKFLGDETKKQGCSRCLLIGDFNLKIAPRGASADVMSYDDVRKTGFERIPFNQKPECTFGRPSPIEHVLLYRNPDLACPCEGDLLRCQMNVSAEWGSFGKDLKETKGLDHNPILVKIESRCCVKCWRERTASHQEGHSPSLAQVV